MRLRFACWILHVTLQKPMTEVVQANPAVSEETLKLLRLASTATLHTQLFKRGIRKTFLSGVRPLNPASSFAGEAFTLRYIPAREDIDNLDVFDDPDNPQRRAIESVGPGQVLIMDCRGDTEAASAGHILVTRLRERGAAALVTDGSLRDSTRIATEDFPAFAAGVSATLSLASHHAVDMQTPISCAGVAVYPGDVVVGDGEGVIVIPRYLADEVAHDAAEQEALEVFILDRIRDGAPLTGTYPPNDATVDAFRSGRVDA